MSLAHLESLISDRETETVEFKQTTAQRKPVAKTVCGMLNNASGGSVVVTFYPSTAFAQQHDQIRSLSRGQSQSKMRLFLF